MKSYIFFVLCIAATLQVAAQVIQWRGPDRNGHFPEKNLLTEWPAQGPEMILKVENVGSGYSSPVYYDHNVFITGIIDTLDYLTRVDMKGNVIFQEPYGFAWKQSYSETRSTPTIEEDRVYLISGMGQVVCLSAVNGSTIWSVDANEVYKGELHRWGVAESPLIVDDKVIYTTGGEQASVVAFNKLTGEEVWVAKSLGGPRAFASPVLYENNGVRLIIAVTAQHLLGIDPESGKIAWHYQNLPEDPDAQRRATIKPNSAIFKGDELFYSRGYDQTCFMLKISPDGQSVTELWVGDVMDTHHGGYVNVGQYIYGSNWESNSKGNWVSLDWNTGEVMYEERWITKGSIVFADGMLYCYEERSGTVALVKPNPEKFDIVSTFKIVEGKGPHWAHPYIVDGKLLIRHGDVLMVFDIKNTEG